MSNGSATPYGSVITPAESVHQGAPMPDTGNSPQPQSRTTVWLSMSIACAIMLFGIIGASITYWSRRELGQQTRSWPGQVLVETVFWLTYLPLIPPVLALARRFRLDPSKWRPSAILVHVLGATLFSLVHCIAVGLVSFAVTGKSGPWSTAIHMLASFALVDFCLYWGILAAVFAIDFYGESVARNVAAAHLRADLTEARLEALRIQLTPHFLFNTLNCMSTMALAGDHVALRAMIDNLAELLRFSLDDRCPQEIVLGRELDFLERYANLQRLQLGDHLLLRRDIASDTVDALVPTLVLQPIVENAILHGRASSGGTSHISVHALRDADMLRLTVSDNGPGFPPSGAPSRHGIGLRNTEQRLKHLYGSNQRVQYSNAREGGAIVTLSFPCRYASAHGPGALLDSNAHR